MNLTGGRTLVGHVAQICRYPVKSMLGERLECLAVAPQGLDGDRKFALIDTNTGRVASAKNPRMWAGLLDLRARLSGSVLQIIAADGTERRSDRDDLDSVLSQLLGRAVTLRGTPLASAEIEIEWPDVAGLLHGVRTRSKGCPWVATVLVIDSLPESTGFVERDWIDRTLLIGETLLRITSPCSRCVMTTLAQPGLAFDPQILRAAVAHNAAAVGVYASADRAGEIAESVPVWLI